MNNFFYWYFGRSVKFKHYFLFDGIYVGMVCIASKGVHLGWVFRSRFCNFQYVDES